MSIRAELGQYILQAHNSKKSEDPMGLFEPQTLPLGTPVISLYFCCSMPANGIRRIKIPTTGHPHNNCSDINTAMSFFSDFVSKTFRHIRWSFHFSRWPLTSLFLGEDRRTRRQAERPYWVESSVESHLKHPRHLGGYRNKNSGRRGKISPSSHVQSTGQRRYYHCYYFLSCRL